MKRRSLLFLPVAILFAAALPAAAQGNAAANRLVIQVNEEDTKKWNAVLGNINNIRTELKGAGVAVTVVAIGPGLGMLTAESLVANKVEDAMAEGVRFVACGNSMQTMNLAADDLIKGVTVTRAGYVEILRLQQQGWTYLRP